MATIPAMVSPAASPAATPAASPDFATTSGAGLMGAPAPGIAGVDTVLLIDDEPMVRKLAATMLRRLGFAVLEAQDGIEGVNAFCDHKDDIRLVLCDAAMPRMNGWETVAALRALAPAIPVVLASGYDEASVMTGDHPAWPEAFLSKPYGLKALGAAIDLAVNGGVGPHPGDRSS
jgi:CheY-like chemotaxis protein